MSIPLIINGQTFDYPEVDDKYWGPDATDWASAVTSGMLQKAGGLFQLLAEVDFGTSYGVKSLYYKSRTSNVADSGPLRLARTDVINWRNQANNGNLSLSVDASDNLLFNGAPVTQGITVLDTATIDLTLAASVLSADIVADSITNSMINSAAAIAYSKLSLSNSIVNADINASAAIAYSKLALSNSIMNADINSSAAIAYSKLNLSGSIVNADIATGAAIAFSKMAALTANRALVSDGSGVVVPATTTATEIGYVNGVTSAIQTQLDTKMTNPMTTGGDLVYGGVSGSPTRLANGSSGQLLTSAGGTSAPIWGPGFPSGSIMGYAGASSPSGWLLCDGSAISRSTYSTLFAIIGTAYGNGDGSTTFNIPDTRGRFLRGFMGIGNVTGSGSASSNNATFTSHGYNRTGTMVRIVSGTLSGLSTLTTYYIIVIDANTLAFSTSLANAYAGTKIVISGANSAVVQQWEDPDAGSRFASSSGGNTGQNIGAGQFDAFQGHWHTGQSGTSGGTSWNSTGAGAGSSTMTDKPIRDASVDNSGNGSPRISAETRSYNITCNYIIKT